MATSDLASQKKTTEATRNTGHTDFRDILADAMLVLSGCARTRMFLFELYFVKLKVQVSEDSRHKHVGLSSWQRQG